MILLYSFCPGTQRNRDFFMCSKAIKKCLWRKEKGRLGKGRVLREKGENILNGNKIGISPP